MVLGSVDVPTVNAFMHEFGVLHFTPKIFIAASGPDQGQAFLNAAGNGNAIGMMVPNGWYGGFPVALSHVMVQDYIARYGGTASDINADVAESYSAGETMAAAVTATRGTVQSQIIAWLHSHSVQTVVGQAKFNSAGENTRSHQVRGRLPVAAGSGRRGRTQVRAGPAPAAARRLGKDRPGQGAPVRLRPPDGRQAKQEEGTEHVTDMGTFSSSHHPMVSLKAGSTA